MPISKKDRIHREHKKAEAAGTRVPVHANGTPVKAAKPKAICAFCRKELDRTNLAILEQHAGTHSAAWTKEKCWPDVFKPATPVEAPATPTEVPAETTEEAEESK